jgi:RNA polymerase sigma-70 factor (ECF subfamily)
VVASSASAFTDALPPGVHAPAGDLAAALHAFHEAGRAAWPTLDVDPAALFRWLGERATPPEARLPDASLAADATLACACVHDAPGAVVAFDRAFAPVIAGAVSRVDGSAAFVDDASQAIRERLFVAAPGAPPRISEYAGRAPLRTWLRAVAVRAALNLRRGETREAHDAVEPDDERLVASADPEMRLAKAHHKAAVEAAVRAAIARLAPRDRTLLRLHLVEGLSIDVLGAHYQVGRSTAARWLTSAREALREHTRAEISARLGPADPASVAAFVRSQLELSALGLLGDAASPSGILEQHHAGR